MSSARFSITLMILPLTLVTASAFASAPKKAMTRTNSRSQANSEVAAVTGSTTIDTEQKPRFQPGFSLGYLFSSDLAQNREPRMYTHRLSAGLELVWNDSTGNEIFTSGLDLRGQYQSFNSEIEDSGRSYFMELADVDMWVSRSLSLKNALGAKHGLTVSGAVSLPSSEESRFEGIKGIYSVSGKSSSSFRGGRFSLVNSLSGSAFAQNFRLSPVTGNVTPDMAASYSLSGILRLPWGFKFTLGAGPRITHYVDGSQTLSANNFQTLSFAWKSFTASLRHSNGNHLNEPLISLWYVDEYRRILSFSMAYAY